VGGKNNPSEQIKKTAAPFFAVATAEFSPNDTSHHVRPPDPIPPKLLPVHGCGNGIGSLSLEILFQKR
jgi:hypothetical protein